MTNRGPASSVLRKGMRAASVQANRRVTFRTLPEPAPVGDAGELL